MSKYFFSTYDIDKEVILDGIDYLSIDTETNGLNFKRDRLCLIQILIKYKNQDEPKIYVIHFPEPKYGNAINLKKLLKCKAHKLFHFARMDMLFIAQHLKVFVSNIICTRILSKITKTYNDRHGLKDLCRIYLNVNLSKNQQCSYWGNVSLTKDQIDYAIGDVLYLYDLWQAIKKECDKEHRYEIAKEAFKLSEQAVKVEMGGYKPNYLIAYADCICSDTIY